MDGPATSTTTARAARRPLNTTVRTTLIVVVGLVFCTLAVVGSTLVFGFVWGEEFSPDNFERRQFRYYEIPVIGIQVTPIEHINTTGAVESLLIAQSYVEAQAAADDAEQSDKDPIRWDLVATYRSTSVDPSQAAIRKEGDARILCQYLDMDGTQGTPLWLDWTKENKKLARVVWPLVAKLAQQRMYVFVPELLEQAKDAKDPDQLRQQLTRSIAGRYHGLAVMQQKQQRHEVALELFDDGLEFDPQNKQLLRDRRPSAKIVLQQKADRGETQK